MSVQRAEAVLFWLFVVAALALAIGIGRLVFIHPELAR